VHGISAQGAAVDVAAMQERKRRIVEQLTGGIAGLFKANGVATLAGSGPLLAGRRVEVTAHDGTVEIDRGSQRDSRHRFRADRDPGRTVRRTDRRSAGALEFTEVPRVSVSSGPG
jgi:dihydrolipoamide dehydrogenase